MHQRALVLLLLVLNGAACSYASEPTIGTADNPMRVDPAQYLDKITLPPGFKISLYARDIAGPRSMALSEKGVLYVGTRGPFGKGPIGKVHAVVDKNRDHQSDETLTIAENLNYPNGVALHNGALYIAEIGTISRIDGIDANFRKSPKRVVVNDDYPKKYHHGWKYIAFGPDGKLYVPVGAPCNICESEKPIFATITRMDPDGSNREIYAHGVRNSVGFDWHPVSGELWFTDNGRDMMGDNRPPEELNLAPRPGLHFGYPYRHGKDLHDNEIKTDRPDSAFTGAEVELPAHAAGLGVEFYTGDSFPDDYRNDLFIAYHGSWNRTQPVGYNIVRVRFKDNKPAGYEVFASGWLIGDKYWGRPVDIELLPDGSMLVSDDHANCIYRIYYAGNKRPRSGK